MVQVGDRVKVGCLPIEGDHFGTVVEVRPVEFDRPGMDRHEAFIDMEDARFSKPYGPCLVLTGGEAEIPARWWQWCKALAP